jgi:CBS domain-containing protein
VLREYAVEPLKVLFAEDVMSTNVLTISSGTCMSDVKAMVQAHPHMRRQRLLPVVSPDGLILGVISWQDVMEKALFGDLSGTVDDFMIKDMITTFPEESLRAIADKMAANHVGVLPVIDSMKKGKLRGFITQFELLTARDHILQEERKKERVLKMWPVYSFGHLNRISGFFSSSHDILQPDNTKDADKEL